MLSYSIGGPEGRLSDSARHLPLRRYLIAAITTLGRPDAIFDTSVDPARFQWMRDYHRFDLNQKGRIQTKKHRPVVPVSSVLDAWLEATDGMLVCKPVYVTDENSVPRVEQSPVDSIRSAWDSMRVRMDIPPGWGPKLIRHSVATILAAQGVNLQEIEILLGHRVIKKTTARYVVLQPDYLSSFQRVIEYLTEELTQICGQSLHPTLTQKVEDDS